jgi:hypothetical protein
MKEIKKITHYNILFDYYNSLLTDKQKEYFIMYFEKDYSLKEVADYYEITRNAVHSALTSTILKLEEFESKLKLVEKNNLRKEYYGKYQETKDEKWLEKLMEAEDNYGI